MPEEVMFKTEDRRPRAEIAETLVAAADGIAAGTVTLVDDAGSQDVTVPDQARFEVEYEVRWTA